ncbi:TRAP transporter small permease [Endozoicomonas sp. OPT23]|uniref:TRAP transporter small permease n=1 Tax=Endozoicomonas sp. OPT23 TaxID=2072845 RepID=UPI00129A954B|nr:TRAP transporter small permease [Endozoicomonas sp. OPT23]MRI34237.1 TRAP transporter small permease [Endozoicomonas sp. OPT23]
MRKLLDWVYRMAGAAAALCIVLVCLLILARVSGRLMGIVVPSSDDFAGFLLAAASFLGLAYTFQTGGHIRVSLFISRFNDSFALQAERFTLVMASVLIGYLSWQLVYLVWESKIYEELSSGYIPVPLWIVQLPMAVGMCVFCLSIWDQTVQSFIKGKRLPLSEDEQLAAGVDE